MGIFFKPMLRISGNLGCLKTTKKLTISVCSMEFEALQFAR